MTYQQCITNETDFIQNGKAIYNHIKNNEKKEFKSLVDNVKITLKDKKQSFKQKYLALKLLRECLLTKNKELVQYTQTKIMERITIVGKYNKSEIALLSQIKNQGDQDIFHGLLLSCIHEWSVLFPTDKNTNAPSTFAKTYQELRQKGISIADNLPIDQISIFEPPPLTKLSTSMRGSKRDITPPQKNIEKQRLIWQEAGTNLIFSMDVLYEALTENQTVESIMDMSGMLFDPVKDYLNALPMKDVPTIASTTFVGEDPNFGPKLAEQIQLADKVKDLLEALGSNKINVQVFHQKIKQAYQKNSSTQPSQNQPQSNQQGQNQQNQSQQNQPQQNLPQQNQTQQFQNQQNQPQQFQSQQNLPPQKQTQQFQIPQFQTQQFEPQQIQPQQNQLQQNQPSQPQLKDQFTPAQPILSNEFGFPQTPRDPMQIGSGQDPFSAWGTSWDNPSQTNDFETVVQTPQGFQNFEEPNNQNLDFTQFQDRQTPARLQQTDDQVQQINKDQTEISKDQQQFDFKQQQFAQQQFASQQQQYESQKQQYDQQQQIAYQQQQYDLQQQQYAQQQQYDQQQQQYAQQQQYDQQQQQYNQQQQQYDQQQQQYPNNNSQVGGKQLDVSQKKIKKQKGSAQAQFQEPDQVQQNDNNRDGSNQDQQQYESQKSNDNSKNRSESNSSKIKINQLQQSAQLNQSQDLDQFQQLDRNPFDFSLNQQNQSTLKQENPIENSLFGLSQNLDISQIKNNNQNQQFDQFQELDQFQQLDRVPFDFSQQNFGNNNQQQQYPNENSQFGQQIPQKQQIFDQSEQPNFGEFNQLEQFEKNPFDSSVDQQQNKKQQQFANDQFGEQFFSNNIQTQKNQAVDDLFASDQINKESQQVIVESKNVQVIVEQDGFDFDQFGDLDDFKSESAEGSIAERNRVMGVANNSQVKENTSQASRNINDIEDIMRQEGEGINYNFQEPQSQREIPTSMLQSGPFSPVPVAELIQYLEPHNLQTNPLERQLLRPPTVDAPYQDFPFLDTQSPAPVIFDRFLFDNNEQKIPQMGGIPYNQDEVVTPKSDKHTQQQKSNDQKIGRQGTDSAQYLPQQDLNFQTNQEIRPSMPSIPELMDDDNFDTFSNKPVYDTIKQDNNEQIESGFKDIFQSFKQNSEEQQGISLIQNADPDNRQKQSSPKLKLQTQKINDTNKSEDLIKVQKPLQVKNPFDFDDTVDESMESSTNKQYSLDDFLEQQVRSTTVAPIPVYKPAMPSILETDDEALETPSVRMPQRPSLAQKVSDIVTRNSHEQSSEKTNRNSQEQSQQVDLLELYDEQPSQKQPQNLTDIFTFSDINSTQGKPEQPKNASIEMKWTQLEPQISKPEDSQISKFLIPLEKDQQKVDDSQTQNIQAPDQQIQQKFDNFQTENILKSNELAKQKIDSSQIQNIFSLPQSSVKQKVLDYEVKIILPPTEQEKQKLKDSQTQYIQKLMESERQKIQDSQVQQTQVMTKSGGEVVQTPKESQKTIEASQPIKVLAPFETQKTSGILISQLYATKEPIQSQVFDLSQFQPALIVPKNNIQIQTESTYFHDNVQYYSPLGSQIESLQKIDDRKITNQNNQFSFEESHQLFQQVQQQAKTQEMVLLQTQKLSQLIEQIVPTIVQQVRYSFQKEQSPVKEIQQDPQNQFISPIVDQRVAALEQQFIQLNQNIKENHDKLFKAIEEKDTYNNPQKLSDNQNIVPLIETISREIADLKSQIKDDQIVREQEEQRGSKSYFNQELLFKIQFMEAKMDESNIQLARLNDRYDQAQDQKASLMYSSEQNNQNNIAGSKITAQQQDSNSRMVVPQSPLDQHHWEDIEAQNNYNPVQSKPIKPFMSSYYSPYQSPSQAAPPIQNSDRFFSRASMYNSNDQLDQGFNRQVMKMKTNGVYIQKYIKSNEQVDLFKRMCLQDSCTILDTFELFIACRYEVITVQNDTQRAHNVVKLVVTYKNKSHMTMNHLIVIVDTQKGKKFIQNKVTDSFYIEPIKISRPKFEPEETAKQEFIFQEFDPNSQTLTCAVGYKFNHLRRQFTIQLARPITRFLDAEFLGAEDISREFLQNQDQIVQSDLFTLGGQNIKSINDLPSIFTWLLEIEDTNDLKQVAGKASTQCQGQIIDILIRFQENRMGKCVAQIVLLNDNNLKLSEAILSYFAFVVGQ